VQAIPDVGQSFAFYGRLFQVEGRKANRLTRLRISPEPGGEA
jgi:Mg2+/Co2+ transporter CorB